MSEVLLLVCLILDTASVLDCCLLWRFLLWILMLVMLLRMLLLLSWCKFLVILLLITLWIVFGTGVPDIVNDDRPFLSVQFSSVQFNSVQLLRAIDPPELKEFTLTLPRSLRKAGQEAKTLVLCKQNDRFPKKLLFCLSKTSFLRPEGLLKAPLGDPSEE